MTFCAPIVAAGVKKGSDKILSEIRENPFTATVELPKTNKLSAKGVEWHLKK